MLEVSKLRGFYSIEVTEHDDEGNEFVVGSAYDVPNVITADGRELYILRHMTNTAGSLRITHVALGTGGAPATNDTTLTGEIGDAAGSRTAATLARNGSTQLQVTATFASANSFITQTKNISNIGLFQQSNTQTATIFAGAAYASSNLATNQNVNVTYNINLQTA